jgi:hypothetical protein
MRRGEIFVCTKTWETATPGFYVMPGLLVTSPTGAHFVG